MVRTREGVSNEMAEDKKYSHGNLVCLVEEARAVLLDIYVRQTKRRQKEMIEVLMTILSLTLCVQQFHRTPFLCCLCLSAYLSLLLPQTHTIIAFWSIHAYTIHTHIPTHTHSKACFLAHIKVFIPTGAHCSRLASMAE